MAEAVPPLGQGNTLGYAARDASGTLHPIKFDRRAVGPDDVEIKITHCGICHSDLHQVKNEWNGSKYPLVPGHEVVGVVTSVGADVKKVSVGQRAGVGCMVGSCHFCKACSKGDEQYCKKVIYTYNSIDTDGSVTYGGYSTRIICKEHFVLTIPDALPSDKAAPLLCAGITTYSPLVHFGLNKPGLKLGVLGLGGLGHMAVLLGKAFGLEVTVLSSTPSKAEEAKKVLGADKFVLTNDTVQMEALRGTLDGIIDTVSAKHPAGSYLGLLADDGKYIVVGAPPEPLDIHAFQLSSGRKTLAGSMIGGVRETQEMLDFCGEKGVVPLIENIAIDYVNTAMERLLKSDVKYRFVIDVERSLIE